MRTNEGRKGVIVDEYNQLYTILNKVSFYNHGYLPLLIDDSDYKLKFSENLYHYAVPFDLTGKTMLEVGCGRGGGIKSLSKHYKFKSLVGCDINETHIKYCKEDDNDIQFDVADAESLPYNNEAFDVVMNIESSHCYPSLDQFFQEVARVLKPSGTFVWCDCFDSYGAFENKLNLIRNNDNFEIQSIEEITNNVIDSLTEYVKTIKSSKDSPYTREERECLFALFEKSLRGYVDMNWKYFNVVINAKV